MSRQNAQEIAERSAAAMWKGDEAARLVGASLESVGPGTAVTSLIIGAQHLNGHNICHGGVIFTLADVAFACACNSYNQIAVAQQNSISYLTPGKLGERLIATAKETQKVGRTGVYDVTVTGDEGKIVAEFRGCSRIIRGQHYYEDEGKS